MASELDILIVGGSGNGRSNCSDHHGYTCVRTEYFCEWFSKRLFKIGSTIGNLEIVGKPDEWRSFDERYKFVFALLTVGKMEERVNRLRELKIPLERLATIVHPTATIADDVVIGAGTVVASNVTCQPGSHIGANCIIRAGACIGHDVVVDDYVDIGPNVSLAGYSKVQLGAQIAPNAVVRDNVVIGSFSVLGAGSAAFKNTEEKTTWVGVPAIRVK